MMFKSKLQTELNYSIGKYLCTLNNQPLHNHTEYNNNNNRGSHC